MLSGRQEEIEEFTKKLQKELKDNKVFIQWDSVTEKIWVEDFMWADIRVELLNPED